MSLEEVSECPVCTQTSFKLVHTCKDHTTSGELFHVKQCNDCGLVMTSPRPTAAHISRYYQSKDYISHTASSNGLIDSIYLIFRHFTLQWKYRLLKGHLLQGALLDFGCGTGHFLKECQKHQTEVYGVEPSEEARKKVSPGIPIVDSLANLPASQFDVITLWHVLEHIYPVTETLRQLKQKLADHGTIFIAVPNCESFDAKYFGPLWAAYDVPRHAWHFSKDSMTRLLDKSGLSIRQIIPMPQDAFYVSLLSEKNKDGGKFSLLKFLRALWIGIRSNYYARQTMNHSSLVFLVKKK